WTVGRYGFSGVDNWKTSKIVPDLSDCNSRGKDYMPVIWPGFSWLNLHGGTFNQHPRYGGDFYWKQAYNAIDAGADFVYVAMFDEVDEGTAMFKIAETEADLPAQLSSTLVTLDEDGESLPSDWYLQLADETQKMLDGTTGLSSTIPISPATANGNAAVFISQSVPSSVAEGASFTATITMKNTGSTTWTKSSLHKLGSQNPQDNTYWGSTRVELLASESISPGNQVTFTLNGTAPSSAGTYNFQWKMVQDNVEWFGSTTDNVLVTVGNSSYLDECENLTGWGSSQSLSLSTNSQQGTNSLQFTGSTEMEYQKVFSPAYNGSLNGSDAILRFWYYVADASKFTGVNQVELGSGGQADSDEYSWSLPALVNGWNLIDLDVSEASQLGTPDINAINWFRLYNFKSASVTTRLDGIQLLSATPTITYLDDCDALAQWGTAGSNSLSLNSTDVKQGSSSIQMTGSGTNEFQKVFSPAYNSGLTPSNARLDFWYYVSDPSKMSTSNNQVEIGSGGAADVNEYHWKLTSFSTGWNFISLDVSAASTTGGTPDLNAINWFRIYNSKSGSVTNRIDGIRLVNKAGSRTGLSHEDAVLNDPKIAIYPNPASE
ncbi:MAG: NBR1-Ig-like domain-containing protein, partial [Marinoscillum sp.]